MPSSLNVSLTEEPERNINPVYQLPLPTLTGQSTDEVTISDSEPYVYHAYRFTLDEMTTHAERISQAAFDLLEYMKLREQTFSRNFALECYRYVDDTSNDWSLRIRLDVSKWFQYIFNNYDAVQVHQNGQNYLRNLKSSIHDIEEATSMPRQIPIPRYCLAHLNYESPRCNNGEHSSYICLEELNSRNGRETCQQWVPKELILPNFAFDHFVILCRPKRLQEVLFMPKPGICSHRNNYQMAASSWFWIGIHTFLREFQSKIAESNVTIENIMGDYISLHYGNWESREFGNPNILECHAHAHITLSDVAQAQFALTFKTSLLVDARKHPLIKYWKQDILHLRYLVAETEVTILKSKILRLEETIKNMAETIKNMAETIETMAETIETMRQSRKRDRQGNASEELSQKRLKPSSTP